MKRERERNKKEERVGDGDPALEDSRPVSNPMRSVCVCVRFHVQVCVLCGSFVCGVCVADLMCSMACVCVMYDMFDLCLFVLVSGIVVRAGSTCGSWFVLINTMSLYHVSTNFEV